MARLPDIFKGRKIVQREPFVMAGTLVMRASQTGQQYPSASFLHNADKPFEIQRLVPRAVGVVALTPVNVTGDFGDRYISARVFDFDRSHDLVKASTVLPNLIKSDRFHTWEFGEPYYLNKGQGFTITLDSSVFDDTINAWSVRIAAIGSLLTLAEGE